MYNSGNISQGERTMGQNYKVLVARGPDSFFQRHSKGVSFIGALIIFLTFIVRDGLREHLKDLVDSINYAELAVNVDEIALLPIQRFDRIDETLQRLNESIGDATDDIHRLQGEDKSYRKYLKAHQGTLTPANGYGGREESDSIENRFSAFDTELLIALASLQNSTLIAKKMGRTAEYEDKLKRFEQRLKQIDQNAIDVRNKGNVTAAQALDSLNVLYKAGEDLRDFSATLLSVAREQRDRDETWYSRFTILSYILFTLGWVLAVMGNFYGVAVMKTD
jgi:hypothetical protein